MQTSLFTNEENFGFLKSLFLVAVFFIIAPLTLGVSIFSLYSLRLSQVAKEAPEYKNLYISPLSGVRVYASLPNSQPKITESVQAEDARVEIIRQYLHRYKSPLLPHAAFIVQTADKYSIDFRLVTAIAQQESNLCKVIPPGGYNCWGWGIHSAGTLGFDSFEHGIETVSQGLKTNYLDKGYTTIEKIMSKYTPLSNGSWAQGVSYFMAEMQ